VEGLDAIRDALAGAARSLPPVEIYMTNFEDQRVIREWNEERMVLFPMRKLTPGKTWKKSVETSLGSSGNVLTHYRCKLDQIVRESADRVGMVSITSTVAVPPGAKPLKAPTGADMVLSDGKISGGARFSEVLGEYVQESAEGHIIFETKGGAAAGAFKADVEFRQESLAMPAEQRAAKRSAAAEGTEKAP
jgi:hypothetical protein